MDSRRIPVQPPRAQETPVLPDTRAAHSRKRHPGDACATRLGNRRLNMPL